MFVFKYFPGLESICLKFKHFQEAWEPWESSKEQHFFKIFLNYVNVFLLLINLACPLYISFNFFLNKNVNDHKLLNASADLCLNMRKMYNNKHIYKLGLQVISHAIVMRISSVKSVLLLLINLHHLLSNGAAFNTQSHSSLTSYAIRAQIRRWIGCSSRLYLFDQNLFCEILLQFKITVFYFNIL